MKRVRVVAITAVALGAAVTAGTKFQQSREAAQMAAASQPSVSVAQAPAAAPQSGPLATPTSLSALAPDAAPAGAAPAVSAPAASAPAVSVAVTPAPAAVARTGQPVSLIAAAPAGAPPANPPRAPAANPAIAAPPSALSQAPGPAPTPGQTTPGLTRASIVPGIDAGPGPVAPATDPETLRVLAAGEPATTPDTAPPLDPALQAEIAACAVWLVVTPAPAAMLETSVYAPCDGGAQITLIHAGLHVDMRLGEDGQMLAQIPALTEQAGVTIQFADGREQSDQTQVPDLAAIERVVLQWQAPADLQLNAYEFGAGYGDAGHVSRARPRIAGITEQGFLTVLGDPSIEAAHLAQVYSYPRGETPRSGSVALEIEVPVTEAICGKPLTANTIELHGTGSAQVRQIRLDMPACDGQGGYLVLPGVLPELQIALSN